MSTNRYQLYQALSYSNKESYANELAKVNRRVELSGADNSEGLSVADKPTFSDFSLDDSGNDCELNKNVVQWFNAVID